MRLYFISLFLLPFALFGQNPASPCDGAQAFHIVVLGSSTAAGSGPSSLDSAWVWRYRAYMQGLNPANQVTNLAKGGYNTYKLMPTAFVPPVGRPAPDTTRNITAGLKLNPDAIIINLPSNDVASGIGPAEQLYNFDTIIGIANALGVPVWVCTTQPRNFSAGQIAQQIEVRDSILARYGNFTLDFWTTIANSGGTIDPLYDSGDGVHLNNTGHRILNQRVINANLPGYLYQPPNYPDFSISQVNLLQPNSVCGDSFQQIQVIVANVGLNVSTSQTIQFNFTEIQSTNSQVSSFNLPGGLNSCTADTFSVTVNSAGGGDFKVEAYSAVPGDSNSSNDTSRLYFSTLGHPVLSVSGDTACAAGSLLLTAFAGLEDTIAWYDAANGGNLLAWGSQFATPAISSSQTFYAEAVRGDLFHKGDISTTQNSNINWNGTMFDLIPNYDMVIDSFSLKTISTGSQAVEIYYKAGSHIGFQQNSSAWTYLGTGTVNVSVAGSFGTFSIPTLNLIQGDTFGIYLQMQNTASTLAYQSLSSTQFRSNGELSIVTGSGVGSNFSATYFPRDWNGSVYYHYGFRPEGDCISERLSVEAVLSFPTVSIGNDTIIDLNTSIVLDPGPGYISYQWSTGATSQTLNLSGQNLGLGIHFITLEATDINGCIALDTVVVGVAVLAGTEEMKGKVKVFPNPVHISWTVEVGIPGNFEFELYASDGRKLFQRKLRLGVNHMERGQLPAGIYYYKIIGQDGFLQSRPLVLQ